MEDNWRFAPQIHITVLFEFLQDGTHSLLLSHSSIGNVVRNYRYGLHRIPEEGSLSDKVTSGQSSFGITSILSDCLFALTLSQNATPLVIFLTDGCQNLLEFVKKDIPIHIVQIGGGLGYSPASSYGYVAETENLAFLALSTSGRLLYGSTYPNFYHRNFLIRDRSFAKGATSTSKLPNVRSIDVTREIYTDSSSAYPVFPWDVKSRPHPLPSILTRYRDYEISSNLDQFVLSRLREGFILQNILTNESRGGKFDKIYFNLTLHWAPHVTIQYRVKSLYSVEAGTPGSPSHSFLKFRSSRVELNILAHKDFAIFFVNIQAAKDRKSVTNNPLYARVVALHNLLKSIYDTDQLKKAVLHVSGKLSIGDASASSPKLGSGIPDSSQITATLTQILESILKVKNSGWFDEYSFDLISRSVTGMGNWSDETELTQDMPTSRTIHDILQRWASFNISAQGMTYVRLLEKDQVIPVFSSSPITSSMSPSNPSFSFVAFKIAAENDYFVSLNVVFFNGSLDIRRKFIRDIRSAFPLIANGPTSPEDHEDGFPRLAMCNRPLKQLYVRYSERVSSNKGSNNVSKETAPDDHGAADELFPYLFTSNPRVWNLIPHSRTIWLRDIDKEVDIQMTYPQEFSMVDLTYDLILNTRLEEGFVVISKWSDGVLLYTEVNVPPTYTTFGREDSESSSQKCAVQYMMFKSSAHIATEIWVEPYSNLKWKQRFFEQISWSLKVNTHRLVSEVYTFDKIHYLARMQNLNSLLKLSVSADDTKNILVEQQSMVRKKSVDVNLLLSDFVVEQENSKLCLLPQCRSFLIAFRVSSSLPSTKDFDSRFANISLQQLGSLFGKVVHAEFQGIKLTDIPQEYYTNIVLHWYFEKALLTISDGEVAPDDCEEFFGDYFMKIKETVEGFLDTSELNLSVLLPTSNDSRCFVKIRKSTSFLLVFVPSYLSSIAERLTTSPNLSEPKKKSTSTPPNHTSVAVIECSRHLPGAGHLPTFSLDSFARRPSKARDQEAPTCVVAPYCFCSDSQPDSTPPSDTFVLCTSDFSDERFKISDYVARFYMTLGTAFNQCFVRTIYSSMLQGHPIQKEDFEKAIAGCVESTIDFNITPFLNCLTLRKRAGLGIDTEIQTRFRKELQRFFRPVSELVEGGSEDIYFYVPKDPQSSKIVDTEENTAITDPALLRLSSIFETAERPLFIKLEHTFQGSRDGRSSIVTSACSSLPLSYEARGDFDMNPDTIGTSTSPLESPGTSATLHVVCLMLPTIDYGSEIPTPAGPDDVIETGSYRTNVVPEEMNQVRQDYTRFLDFEKQTVLAEFENRIDWFLKEEILNGLLQIQPVSPSLMSYLQQQLKTKNPYSDNILSFSVSPQFVRPPKDIFLDELAKANVSPYTLNKLEHGWFYLSDDDVTEVEIPDDKSVDHSSPEYATKVDEYDGLGIFVASQDEIQKPQKPKAIQVVHKQSFWLIFSAEGNNISIHYFNRFNDGAIKEPEAVKLVKSVIMNVCDRTNRLILLKDLRETHTCSKYLVPPDGLDRTAITPTDAETDANTSQQAGATKPPRRFAIGQFECPSVFRHQFSLHWRLKTHQALSSVVAMLQPLAVTNRKNLFVVSSKENQVYYMRCVEVGVQVSQSDADLFSDVQHQHSPSTPGNSESKDVDSHVPITVMTEKEKEKFVDSPRPDTPSSPQPSRKSTLISTRSESRVLTLELFGVDPPHKDFAEELINMFESKISSITLSIISTFLARSSTVKLTKQDVEFIMPIKGPKKRDFFGIPSFVGNPYLLLQYLKQNLSLYLNVVNSTDVNRLLKRHFEIRFDTTIPFLKETSESPIHEIQPGDFTFLYNCISSRNPTTIETAVGQGVACLSLSLVDQNDRLVFELPAAEIAAYSDSPVITMESLLKLVETDIAMNDMSHLYKIMIEIWIPGTLNVEALSERLRTSMIQSVCDYLLESCFLANISTNRLLAEGTTLDDSDEEEEKSEERGSLFGTIEPSLGILEFSAKSANPAVHEFKEQFRIPQWMYEVFLSELGNTLKDINTSLTQVILKCIPTESDVRYEFYVPGNYPTKNFKSTPESLKFIVISGINTLPRRMSSLTDSRLTESKAMSASEQSSQHSLDETTTESENAVATKYRLGRSYRLSKNPLADLMLYGNTVSQAKGVQGLFRTELERNCVIELVLDSSGIMAYAYNWKKAHFDMFAASIKNMVAWHTNRVRLLKSILFQKMGLFYHPTSSISASSFQTSPNHLLSAPSSSTAPVARRTSIEIDIETLIINPFPRSTTTLAEPKWPRESSLLKLCQVLKEGFPEFQPSKFLEMDSVVRHGSQFMDCYAEQLAMLTTQDHLLSIYNKWSKRHSDSDSPSADSEELSTSDLSSILRSVRLLHWCRTPLLFTQLRDSLFFLNSNSFMSSNNDNPRSKLKSASPAPPSDDQLVSFYQKLVSTFMSEYIAYLKSLGMNVILSGKSNINLEKPHASLPTATPRFVISDDLSLETGIVYLQKSFQGGVLLVEFSVGGMFACVNLYTVNRRYGRYRIRQPSPGFNTPDYSRQSFKLFTEECAKFKNLIHVNSFVYDFHLRYFQEILDDISDSPPLNLLDTIKAFIRYNPTVAKFARSRIHHGTFTVAQNEITNDLLPYILKNPSRYGFTALNQEGYSACFVSSISPRFESDYFFSEFEHNSTQFRFSLIIFPPNTTESGTPSPGVLKLQYFLLAVNQQNGTPYLSLRQKLDSTHPSVDTAESSGFGMPRSFSSSPLLEPLGSTGMTLENVVKNAEQKVRNIVDQAVRYFSRDTLWNSLISGKVYASNAAISVEDFLVLSRRFNSRPLLSCDPSLAALFEVPGWTGILDSLVKHYGNNARELHDGLMRHVAIFDPSNRDFLIQFLLREETVPIEVYAVSREGQEQLSPKEQELVNSVICSIGYSLWNSVQRMH
ncbi:hypothetical protein BKA69DRAFT_1048792 [Paraphysoderma sedebokerense]|nr:hypothetical protein BKA69DRAFT_1048792 [Paraphysoderma sedebokerense]